jgi:hypothetical protein
MRFLKRQRSIGSALLAASMSAGILAILVAGFLTMVSSEYALSRRSHHWQQALHLAEASVEQALAEFNYRYLQGGNGFQTDEGWTGSGGSYSKTVTNFTDNASQIVGHWTVTVSGVGASNPQLIGEGTVVVPHGGDTITRAVRVTLASSSQYPKALVSKTTISFSGNNAYVDSFDSSDPSKSTNGQYDSNKKQANGDLATNGTASNAIDLGNADIYGNANTGDGGTVDIGPNGSIGPTFTNGDRTGSEVDAEANGWITHDFQSDIPDASLPSGASWVSLASVPNTINAGDYTLDSMSLSGKKTVTISGYVRLHVTGNISMAGQSQIIILPGAKLEIYGAGSIAIAGNGISNQPGLSSDCQIIGLPTCTSVSVTGNGAHIGTVYAPQATVTVSGNGDVSGAVVASVINMTGNGGFHYDEALKSLSGSANYSVASWQSGRIENGTFVVD